MCNSANCFGTVCRRKYRCRRRMVGRTKSSMRGYAQACWACAKSKRTLARTKCWAWKPYFGLALL